jgi:MoaA/NifB/PqqE/SkfB family radical SAM enzyme
MASVAAKTVQMLPFVRAKLVGRPRPLNVALHVTHRCNQNCTYCDRHLAPNDQTHKSRELTPAELCAIARQFIRMGARGFLLDGGEPLVRRDLEPLLKLLSLRGVAVRLNTNGTLLSRRPDWLPYFSKIKISIDGPREIHERFRGPGTFSRALDGLKTAKRAKIPVELTCVISSVNVSRIPEILHLARKLQTRIFLQPARGSLFVGKKRDSAAYTATLSALQNGLAWLLENARHPALGNSKASLRHFLEFPHPTTVPCSAGWVSCAVDPYGKMTACPMIPMGQSSPDLRQCSVESAFFSLARTGCRNCWCARQVELNFAWAGEFWRFL